MCDQSLGALVAAGVILGIAGAIAARELSRAYRRRRSIEQHRALCRHLFANRPKARIVRVGRITMVGHNDHGPIIVLNGWSFAPDEPIALSTFLIDGERDRELFLGWTREELIEATKQPAEFEETEAIR